MVRRHQAVQNFLVHEGRGNIAPDNVVRLLGEEGVLKRVAADLLLALRRHGPSGLLGILAVGRERGGGHRLGPLCGGPPSLTAALGPAAWSSAGLGVTVLLSAGAGFARRGVAGDPGRRGGARGPLPAAVWSGSLPVVTIAPRA